MTVVLLRGDARSLPLPSDSVDVIVTSPPYFGLRSYTDGGEHYASQIGAEETPREFIAALVECTREMARVLKSSGSIFVNLGDKYARPGGGVERAGAMQSSLPGASRKTHRRVATPTASCEGIPEKSLMLLPERYRIACVDELSLIARAVIVWDKPNGLPESVRDRVRRSHEDWVHLTKSPRYFQSVDGIREPASDYVRASARRSTPSGQRPRAMTDSCNPAGRLPGSVWSVPTQPLRVPPELDTDHFAAFPMEWPRRLITGWCPPGGVVLDPFGGTGTTTLVADVLGRVGISLDASEDYGRIARWRTTDERERAAAAGNDRAAVVAPTTDAPGLFEAEEVSA